MVDSSITETAERYLSAAEEEGKGIYIQYTGPGYQLRAFTADYVASYVSYVTMGPLTLELVEAWLYVFGEEIALLEESGRVRNQLYSVRNDMHQLWNETEEGL